MEKEGLIRSVEFKTLVTDRHTFIRKWIRENMAQTKHCFDVWHVAKGELLAKSLISWKTEEIITSIVCVIIITVI